jgi:O-antigen/teichoic acid export membrane protein
VLGFTIVAAEPIVLLLFGEQFRDAAPALPILMGAFVLISLGHVTGHLVLVLHLQRVLLAYAAAGLVLNVGLNVLLIPSYGFLAAAWVTLATELLFTGLVLVSVTRKLGHRPMLGRLGRIVAGTAAATGALALAQLVGVPLGVLVALALLAYPLALLGLGAVTVADIRELVRSPGSPGASRL